MSDSDDERADEEWNYRARHETETQRLDRNWAALLQELRIVQTGVQLLTGFLLTLPFQQRFADLTDFEVGVYLVTVALSSCRRCCLSHLSESIARCSASMPSPSWCPRRTN